MEDPYFGPVALRPPDHTTIDGGGVITLAGWNVVSVLVDSDTTVVLKNLHIRSTSLFDVIINATAFAARGCGQNNRFASVAKSGA